MDNNTKGGSFIDDLEAVLNRHGMILLVLPSGKYDIMTKAEYESERKELK